MFKTPPIFLFHFPVNSYINKGVRLSICLFIMKQSTERDAKSDLSFHWTHNDFFLSEHIWFVKHHYGRFAHYWIQDRLYILNRTDSVRRDDVVLRLQ